MSERRIQELLKEKQLYQMYRNARSKQGDKEVKSTSDIKKEASTDAQKRLLIQKTNNMSQELVEPVQQVGESDDDFNLRYEDYVRKAEEIENDLQLQENQNLIREKDRLRKSFERIMTPGEAQQMMLKVDDDNVIKLNKYWTGFEKKLRDQFSSIDFDSLEEFIIKYIDIVENGSDQISMLKSISQDVKDMKSDFKSINDSIDTLQDDFNGAKVDLKNVVQDAVKTGNKKLIKAVESVNKSVDESYKKLSKLADNRDSMTEEQILDELSKLSDQINRSTEKIQQEISNASSTANSNQLDIYRNLASITHELSSGFESLSTQLDENKDDIEVMIEKSLDNYAEIIDQLQSQHQTDEDLYLEKLAKVVEEFKTPAKSQPPLEFRYDPVEPDDDLTKKDLTDELDAIAKIEEILNPSVETQRTTQSDVSSSIPNYKMKFYTNSNIKEKELTKLEKTRVRNTLANPSFTDEQGKYLAEAEKKIAKPGLFGELVQKRSRGEDLYYDDYDKKVVPLVREIRNQYILDHPADPSAYLDAKRISQAIIGMGLKEKIKPPETKLDDLKLLGRYYIDTNKLSNNQLRLFHQSGNHVKYFKQQLISDDLVNLINFILEKKKYNEKLFHLLEDDEKTLFKNIFMKSGLGKMLNVYIYDNTNKDAKKKYEDLKERVAILQGEIDAGNDNKQVVKDLNETLKELKQQIVYMSQLGLINLKTAQMMILSL